MQKRIWVGIIQLFLIDQVIATEDISDPLCRQFTFGGRRIILSAMDDFPLQKLEGAAYGMPTYLFAKQVTLPSSIAFSGGAIVTQRLIAPNGSKITIPTGQEFSLVVYNGQSVKEKLEVTSLGDNVGEIYVYGARFPQDMAVNLHSKNGRVYFYHEKTMDGVKQVSLNSDHQTTLIHQVRRIVENSWMNVHKQYPSFFWHPILQEMLLDNLETRFIFTKALPEEKAYQTLRQDLTEFTNHLALFRDPSQIPLAVRELYESAGEMVGARNAVAHLNYLARRSALLAEYVCCGLDYYGRSYYDVPLLSYSFLKKQLEEKYLPWFKHVSDLHRRYYEDVQSAENLIAYQQTAVATYEIIKEGLESELKAIKDRMGTTIKALDKDKKEMAAIRAELNQNMRTLKSTIKGHLNFNLETLLEAGTMLCFSPTKAMGLVQGIKMIHELRDKVKDDRGMNVNKDYLLYGLKRAQDRVSTVHELFSSNEEGNPIAWNRKEAHQIVIEKERFDKLMGDFYSAFEEDIGPISELFEKYVDIADKMNQAVIDYNQDYRRGLELSLKMEEADQTIKASSQEFQNNLDLSSISYLSSITGIYRESKALVLDKLSGVARAFRFIKPTDQNILDCSDNKFFYDGTLAMLQGNMFCAYEELLREWSRSVVIPFEPVQWDIRNPELLRRFRTYKKSAFPLTEEEGKKLFNGKANIRLDKVHVSLVAKNLIQEQKKIHIDICHTGCDDIRSLDGRLYRFFHEPRYTFCESIGNQVSAIQGALINSAADVPEKNIDARVGPFTKWFIDVSANEELDLSQLEAIQVTFYGTARALIPM